MLRTHRFYSRPPACGQGAAREGGQGRAVRGSCKSEAPACPRTHWSGDLLTMSGCGECGPVLSSLTGRSPGGALGIARPCLGWAQQMSLLVFLCPLLFLLRLLAASQLCSGPCPRSPLPPTSPSPASGPGLLLGPSGARGHALPRPPGPSARLCTRVLLSVSPCPALQLAFGQTLRGLPAPPPFLELPSSLFCDVLLREEA